MMTGFLALCICALIAVSSVAAHETRPTIAELSVTEDKATLRLTMALEAPMAGINLDGLKNISDAVNTEAYDNLRAMSREDLAKRLRLGWGPFSGLIELKSGDTPLTLTLQETTVPVPGNVKQARDSVVVITAQLPSGDDPVVLSTDPALGKVLLRHETTQPNVYAEVLNGEEESAPVARVTSAKVPPFWDTAINYGVEGFDTILPKGLDHVLFVLGLFFLSAGMRPLLVQFGVFTVAYSTTLVLASNGLFEAPSFLVEPLIALSVAYVAVQTILANRATPTQTLIIFGFGLLHGVAFASDLAEIGLSQGQASLSLISFNIGLVVGQMAVIGAAYFLLARLFSRRVWYRMRVDLPVSTVIALIGLFGFIERIWPFSI